MRLLENNNNNNNNKQQQQKPFISPHQKVCNVTESYRSRCNPLSDWRQEQQFFGVFFPETHWWQTVELQSTESADLSPSQYTFLVRNSTKWRIFTEPQRAEVKPGSHSWSKHKRKDIHTEKFVKHKRKENKIPFPFLAFAFAFACVLLHEFLVWTPLCLRLRLLHKCEPGLNIHRDTPTPRWIIIWVNNYLSE